MRYRTFAYMAVSALLIGAFTVSTARAEDTDDAGTYDAAPQGMMGYGTMPMMYGYGMSNGGMMQSYGMGPNMSGSPMVGHGMMMMGRLMALDLSRDQRRAIDEIHLDAQRDIIPKEGDIRLKRLELRETLMSDDPNEDEVRQRITQINTLEAQIEFRWTQALLQSRDILTPEQRDRFMDPNWMPTVGQNRGRGVHRAPGGQYGNGMGPGMMRGGMYSPSSGQ